MINVTIWNEFRDERNKSDTAYPDGIHVAIKNFIDEEKNMSATAVHLDMPEYGLSDELLDNTDVLIWHGHVAHNEVPDELVAKIQDRVLRGMGLIALHSAHFSKIFKVLMGTSCSLKWRGKARERIWCCNPGHPIAQGVPEQFELLREEMYGEFFDIPHPDELVFLGWFDGGEVL